MELQEYDQATHVPHVPSRHHRKNEKPSFAQLSAQNNNNNNNNNHHPAPTPIVVASPSSQLVSIFFVLSYLHQIS